MTFLESINVFLDAKLCACCLKDTSVAPWFREAPDAKLCDEAQQMCSECRLNHDGVEECRGCGARFCAHKFSDRMGEVYCSDDCEFESRPDGTMVPCGERYVEVVNV